MFRVESGPMLELSELTSRSVHVVLSGQGADELFAGYPFFAFDKVRRRLEAFPLALLAPGVRRCLDMLVGPNTIFPPPEVVRGMEARVGCYPALGILFGLLRSLKGLYAPDLRAALGAFEADDELALPREALAGRDPLDQSVYVTYKVLLEAYNLSVQGDRPAMAHAVEMRFPFLDHELVRVGTAIPPRLRHHWFTEKYILRRALRGAFVAPAIARRRKRIFAAPYGLPFVGRHTPAWVQDLLSPATIARKGYFDPAGAGEAVTRLEALARRGDPWRVWGRPDFGRLLYGMYRDGIAVNLILTVHLWDDLFLRNGTVPPGAGMAAAAAAP
jgi:asparagine synthase (glutamine-hydrolysing)